MANVSKTVIPGAEVDMLFARLQTRKTVLAKRLGISHIAFQQWRKAGASTTAAVVLSTLAEQAIPAGDLAALNARVDVLRQAAVASGYDAERVDEILVEIARKLASGQHFEASSGAEPVDSRHLAQVMDALGLDEDGLADLVGFHRDSVRNWLSGKTLMSAMAAYWIRRRAAAALVAFGDELDALERALGDVVVDALHGGWDAVSIAGAFEDASAPAQALGS